MNKKNLILGGVLVALVLMAYLYQGPFQSWKKNHNKPSNFLSSLKFDKVDRIKIKKKDKTVTLIKDGDKWKVDGSKGFYVSQDKVESIKTALTNIKDASLGLVSEKKEKKGDFKTNESGVALKFMQDKIVLADFVLGGRTSDYNGSYISQANSEKTYSLGVDLVGIFAENDDWYDKTIFSVDKAKVVSLRFQYPDSKAFMIEKGKDGKWSGTQPFKFPVNESKLSKILDTMSSLQASSIPKQEFKGTGLEKHSIIVQATGEGIDNTIMIGDKDKGGSYFAKKGDSDNIYLITKDQRDALNKRISDFK